MNPARQRGAPDLPPAPGGPQGAPTARAAGAQRARETDTRTNGAAAGTPSVPKERKEPLSVTARKDAAGTGKSENKHPFNDPSFMQYNKNTEWLVRLAGFRHFGWNKSSVKMMVLDDTNAEDAANFVSAKDWASIHKMISSAPVPENPFHNISFCEGDSLVPVRTEVKRQVLFFLHGKRKTSFKVITYQSKRYTVSVKPEQGTLDPEGSRAAIIEITLTTPFTTGVDVEIPLVFWRGDQDQEKRMVEYGKYANYDVFVCPLRSQVECARSAFVDPDVASYEMAERLGFGTTGIVYRGTYCDMDVACKVMKDDQVMNREKEYKEFLKDVNKMAQIPTHPCIVNFFGAVAEPPGKYWLLMELCEYGSLLHAMNEYQTKWTTQMKVKAMYDCARAMSFLHQNGIIHRDLKLENILVVSLDPRSQVVCKLSDFGSTKKKQRAMGRSILLSTQGVGTPLFMAPEMFGDVKQSIEALDPEMSDSETSDSETPEKKKYTNKVDVYSFGITIAGTINGKQPYYDQDPKDLSHRNFYTLVERGMRPRVANEGAMPKDLVKLMKECWDIDPTKRPSFDIIVKRLKTILDGIRD